MRYSTMVTRLVFLLVCLVVFSLSVKLLWNTVVYNTTLNLYTAPYSTNAVIISGTSACEGYDEWANANLLQFQESRVTWDHIINFRSLGKTMGLTYIIKDPSELYPTKFRIKIAINDQLNCSEAQAITIKELMGSRAALQWWLENPEFVYYDDPEWTVLMDGLALEYILTDPQGYEFTKHQANIYPAWDGVSIPSCEQLNGVHRMSVNEKIITEGGIQDLLDANCH